LGRKCSNLLPGRFNKLCSTYFGGHYHGLYDGSDDEEFEDRFTHRKAMMHLRRLRGQAFLADRKVGEWSFPCEVIGVSDEAMHLRQWVPEGGEEDYVEPQFKDMELKIFLEPEVLRFVYVYGSPLHCCVVSRLLGLKTSPFCVGGCISREHGTNYCRAHGIWIKLPYIHAILEIF